MVDKEFQLTDEEYTELVSLSDSLNINENREKELAEKLHEVSRVTDTLRLLQEKLWEELGNKYGFSKDTILKFDEKNRKLVIIK